MSVRPQVIALEEHYLDPEIKQHTARIDGPGRPHITARLEDVGQGRLAEMDAAGIDMQVLSHAAPSLQKLPDAELAVRLARAANDRLADTVAAHPDRFAGFAALPTPDPAAEIMAVLNPGLHSSNVVPSFMWVPSRLAGRGLAAVSIAAPAAQTMGWWEVRIQMDSVDPPAGRLSLVAGADQGPGRQADPRAFWPTVTPFVTAQPTFRSRMTASSRTASATARKSLRRILEWLLRSHGRRPGRGRRALRAR